MAGRTGLGLRLQRDEFEVDASRLREDRVYTLSISHIQPPARYVGTQAQSSVTVSGWMGMGTCDCWWRFYWVETRLPTRRLEHNSSKTTEAIAVNQILAVGEWKVDHEDNDSDGGTTGINR